MAYVSVPKDLTKVKNKVAFNLTKRQLICIGIGAAMGIPCYFLFRNALGINNAAVLMVLMMPNSSEASPIRSLIPCVVLLLISSR